MALLVMVTDAAGDGIFTSSAPVSKVRAHDTNNPRPRMILATVDGIICANYSTDIVLRTLATS